MTFAGTYLRSYFGPHGGLAAILGVPVIVLFIMAVPGAPVLPPIVSSLPTAFWHPDALREEATPPAPFPAVVPLLLGLKPLVPGVLGPL